MYFRDFVNFKINELYGNIISRNYISNFFHKSILHYAICLEISYRSSNGGISYEELCSRIPNLIGSRSSIQTVLNEGVKCNCFEKITRKLDKKVKKYFLSKDSSVVLTNWFIDQKEFLLK
tara:strand:+ start:186 stop:545 length:360 start_codon:yes stop_codon:yes gene_type:complete